MRIIWPKVWKSIVFSSRLCYGSVCHHPFMVALMTFVVYMYRSFPSLFFFLVSASPVIISTGILLGILLIYGQPNVPQPHIAKTEENITLKADEPSKTVFMRDAAAVGRFTGKLMDEANSEVDTESEMEKEDAISTVLAREIQSDKRPFEEVKVSGFMVKRGIDGDKIDNKRGIENRYSLIQEMVDEDDDETGKAMSSGGSIDTRLADVADSSVVSQGEESDDYGVVSDSESDSDESSIPDPSMADIMPMLDELHPLLEEDAPQPVHVTSDDEDSDAVSEPSQNNGDSAKESDDEGDEDDDDDDDDDENDDEEDEVSGKVGQMKKSAIIWTEDDHKNVLNLGSSELERNQRLENLIARRRAHRTISERNLIDLESSDVQSNVAHISTKRQNPFDLPFDDSYGLPLIPGSAPSMMAPRQNPFDVQFDLNEEKREGSQQQASMPFQPKESSSSSAAAAAASFRRHESFNMGPSVFALSRQEKFDAIFRPYFFQYQLGLEGTTSYSSIPRNSSEPSESKASSDSSSSVSDDPEEDEKQNEEEEEDLLEEPSDSEHHPLQSVGHDIESSLSSSSSSSSSEDAVEHDKTEDNIKNHYPELTEKMLDEREHSPERLEENRSGDEDVIQHKETPVYDSSPNSVQRSLFDISSDSSTMDNVESDSGDRSLEMDDASSKVMQQPSDEEQKNNEGDH